MFSPDAKTNLDCVHFIIEKKKVMQKRILNKLQITDLAEQCYRELSGGQKQRVLLARALCATKKDVIVG